MEILSILETYWGFTLFGGVSVGLVVMNVWFLVKQYFTGRNNNVLLDTALSTIDQVLKRNHQEEYAKAELLLEQEYHKKVTALVFKYLNFLTVSSKLPADKKVELIEESQGIQVAFQQDMEQLLNAIKEDAVEKVQEIVSEHKATVTTLLDQTLASTTSLLDKYTAKEE